MLAGDDETAVWAERTRLLDGRPPEVFDAGADPAGIVAAVSVPALFGDRRVVVIENFERLDQSTLETVRDGGTGAFVVAIVSGKAPKKVTSVFGDVSVFNVPKGRSSRQRVADLFRGAGFDADKAVIDLCDERSGHDLGRLRSVIAQLTLSGVRRPNVRQIEMLLGSVDAPPAPWDVTDRLEAGDAPGAIRVAQRLDPVAVTTHLARRAVAICAVLESNMTDRNEVASALGMHPFAAQKLVAAAKTVALSDAREAVQVTSSAQRAVRGGPNRDATVDVLLVNLARLWGRR